MKRLTGVQTVTGYATDRGEVLRMIWAAVCLLIRGNVAFKMSVPPGRPVLVPDHCTLEPVQPTPQEREHE